MVIRSRGESVGFTEDILLKAGFQSGGVFMDTDEVPYITIIQPSGNVMMGPTNTGVYKIKTGWYAYQFHVPYFTSLGIWTDFWSTSIAGIPIEQSFNFVVQNTQLPAINSDGYEHLGDDVGYNFSATGIHNINKLLKMLKRRLNSSGKAKSKDNFGNVIYIDCDIFSLDELITFLCAGLDIFNQIPHYTTFDWDSTPIIDQFGYLIVQGAVFQALAAKALIEKGTEFTIQDNGISHNPASVADLLNSQYGTEIANHTEMVKLVKANMKPFPLGLGTLTSMTLGRNTYIHRVRRARAFY